MYDDGGISGGTMDRPALKRLLADIAKGAIDTVVVYKVDRLTRSLADFAKIVEVFEANGATFVSVTQSFNTTTSMGRLTLNMLLSFDKIAASKRKGMWMGGLPPLGYDVVDRKLVINDGEAETVRHIFRRYAALGSVRALQNELALAGIAGKRRIDRFGRVSGGKAFGRGALYLMLQNPIYRGQIVHKENIYWSAPLGLDRMGRSELTGAGFSEEESPCQDTEATAPSSSARSSPSIMLARRCTRLPAATISPAT